MEEQLTSTEVKDKKMSIFGDLDTANVPDDPFYTKPDTYWAVCTDAKERTTNQGQIQCVITWTIDEPDNEYHGNNVQEYYSLYPEKHWEDYSPDEKRATKFFMRRLRRGFDLSESEVQTVQYSELIGKSAYITLKESAGKAGTANEGKVFVNVQDALCKRLYDEENSSSVTAKSVGL